MSTNDIVKNPKKAIYTSLVGNYDDLKEPTYIMKGWDYICFSNDIELSKNSIWKVRPILYKNKDNLRLSRYVKLNPHAVLKEYEFSLWLDSNITMVNNDLENKINDLINKKFKISIPKHKFRNCIYDEAVACINDGRDHKNIIKKQVTFLKKNNFPQHQGLFENNIIFRNHNDVEIVGLSNSWWDLYCKYSKRDQLSLVYLLWKRGLHCEPLLDKNISAKDYSGVKYLSHRLSFQQKVYKKIRKIKNNMCFF
jgi:hypothetical protein